MRSARRGRKGDGANFDRTQIGARRERIESRGGARREPKRGSRFGGSSTRGSARVLTRATCLRLPRRGLDPRRPCLARPARLPIWLSLASGAREKENGNRPTCAPRADFARKKAKRFRALTRRQATVGVDVAHTRARDRFRQTRRTLSVASGARSARAITDRRVSRRGVERATHAALSKRSRARRFPEKKGIIVVKRRGVPSRAGRDA